MEKQRGGILQEIATKLRRSSICLCLQDTGLQPRYFQTREINETMNIRAGQGRSYILYPVKNATG